MTNGRVVNNKLVIKNTSFLYIRMIVLMCISLYTSRIVLEALGIINFGIYNVVGGVITLFSFLNNSMSNAVQRFLSYEIGKGSTESIRNIFNLSIRGHIIIAIIIVIVAEVVGLYLVNCKLDIPRTRLIAANWVLQSSILITLISILQVPYNALILSQEKMGVFAYLSLLEGTLRLLIAFAVLKFSTDKLILYAILQFTVSTIIFTFYFFYCNKKFVECKITPVTDKKAYKPIFSFVSYNLIGEIAQACTGEGLSIVLNIFCGPAVNAARGLANQVNGNVAKFVSNFTQALNPQIIKSYAVGDLPSMEKLLYQGTKLSYYLLYLISLPLILEMNTVLEIWLKNTPVYTSIFCKIVLIASLIGCCSSMLSQAVRANGNIKYYQIICSLGGLLSLPIAYILMKVYRNPILGMSILIVVQIILYFTRVIMTSRIIGLSKISFIKNTLKPILFTTLISMIIPLIIEFTVHDIPFRPYIVIVSSIVSVMATVYMVGLTSSERNFINTLIKHTLKPSK